MKKKGKRLIGLVIALALILPCLSYSVFAADIIDSGTCGINLTWTLDADGLLTISGTGAMPDYVLIDTYAPWYNSRESVKSVIINSGVTRIGNRAFFMCSELTSIVIPDSVTWVGVFLFAECKKLTSAAMSNNLTTIGTRMFTSCFSSSNSEISIFSPVFTP